VHFDPAIARLVERKILLPVLPAEDRGHTGFEYPLSYTFMRHHKLLWMHTSIHQLVKVLGPSMRPGLCIILQVNFGE